jgi:hypothetical protein
VELPRRKHTAFLNITSVHPPATEYAIKYTSRNKKLKKSRKCNALETKSRKFVT